jgi:hypothetical protein
MFRRRTEIGAFPNRLEHFQIKICEWKQRDAQPCVSSVFLSDAVIKYYKQYFTQGEDSNQTHTHVLR